MDFITGVIVGVLIYSFLQTLLIFYKDIHSGYYDVEIVDIVFAGPIAWIVCLIILVVIHPIYRILHSRVKGKEYQPKSKAYIKKVVKKIVRNYAKQKQHDEYFDFTQCWGDYYGNYYGFRDLRVHKPRNERINNRFMLLMFHQPKETIEELNQYFEVVTEDMMKKNDYDEYYIQNYKDKGLRVLKVQ